MFTRKFFLIAICLFAILNCEAQEKRKKRNGEFFFSWGYNKEWYTKSNVKISQPQLGNNYQFKNIRGHDFPGWDEGLLTIPLTIPQYNYRIGYFFNDKKNLGIEINFDHTKFLFTDGQQARMSGTFNNRFVDTTINIAENEGFFYYLNNGANFFLINIIKRWQWCKSKNMKIDLLGKAGIGPVVPHVENSFFAQKNDPGFQLGGWNTGIETALRTTFFNHVYLEFAGKLDYARYSNLKIYKGRARHAFGTAELILSLGYTFKQRGYKM